MANGARDTLASAAKFAAEGPNAGKFFAFILFTFFSPCVSLDRQPVYARSPSRHYTLHAFVAPASRSHRTLFAYPKSPPLSTLQLRSVASRRVL